MNNQVWFGPSIHSGDRKFHVPDDYELTASGCGIDPDGRKWGRVKGVRWFTNLDHNKRHELLPLFKRYSPEEYPKYVNYDAIHVARTDEIPLDYSGEMSVPITFLDKFCPDQFELIGYSLDLAKPMSEFADAGTYSIGGKCFYSRNLTDKDRASGYMYHREYDRLVIRNKHPES